jgi:DNA-binding transcriptional LysR family regulator
MESLSGLNLNLLTVLNTLLKEQNVSKTAKKLNLTQPTISNSLKQLRQIFDDELLFRGPANKMLLTNKAKKMLIPVSEAISKIQAVFTGEEHFNPKVDKYHFTIGMSDYASIIYLPKLMKAIKKFSENITVEVVHLNNMWNYEDFASANIDLAIGNYAIKNEAIVKYQLFESQMVCIASKKHPAFQGNSLSQNDFFKYQHLQVFYKKEFWEEVDKAIFKQTGRERKIALQIPHMLVALGLINDSDFLCLLSDKIATRYADKYECSIQKSPIELPKSTYSVYWSKADHSNPANIWLRNIIKNIESP